MNDSILNSIKKLLGIASDYTIFDQDIIIHINSVFMILMQLGVGPTAGYSITDESNVWSEFVDSSTQLEAVKSYVYLRVRLLFDPPQSGSLIDAITKTIDMLEWRLNVEVDPGVEI